MFDVPASAPVTPPRRLPVPTKHATWTALTAVKPPHCDHCVQALAEGGHAGPVPRRMRWRRRPYGLDGRPDPAADLLLCSEHAQMQRERDELTPVSPRGNQ